MGATVDWIPDPNKHLCKLQRIGLRARLALQRLRGEHLSVRVRLLDDWITLDVSAARELRRAGEFPLESAMVEHMLAHLRPGDRVYDIGANIGLISLVLAHHGPGRECVFHCFEPEPRNHVQLSRNIEVNSLVGRVHGHRLALGRSDGKADLFVRGTAGEGRHSLAASGGATGTIEVPVMTMAHFAAANGGAPNVIKIDVEGAEGDVLAGMDELAADQRPREVFLEIHNKGMGDRMPDGATIEDWLTQRGYVTEWRQRRRSGIHCHFRRA